MGQPVVWFEVLGSDGARSQRFYSELFGWRPRPAEGAPDYGLVDGPLPGGVGQAQGAPHVTFYVGVADAAATLARAE
ncbi:MAG TPA: glyoxalase, partial [Myxococcota bacterium]|nr:glyoxalase [Myxococcota bacterium]